MTIPRRKSPNVLIGSGESRDLLHKLRSANILRTLGLFENWFLGVDLVDYEVSSTLLSKNGVLQSRRGSRKTGSILNV